MKGKEQTMSLSEHKIKEVKHGIVRNTWPRLVGKNGRLAEHGYGYDTDVVILKTDTGYTGWGVGKPDPTLKLFLEGARLSDVFSPETGILHKGYRAADMALHDLAGNILGIPVSRMINPKSSMKAQCYDGAIYFNDLTEYGDRGVEAVLKDARDDALLGYTDYKIKIGRGKNWMEREAGLKRDVDIVRAIRKEFPKSRLLVDANDTMDLQTVISFMEQVKDCDIFWVEEPFHENYDDCIALKEYLRKESPRTLLADGEANYDFDLVIDLAKRGALDVLLMDPVGFGFTAWRRLIEECRGTGILCSPHSWGMKVKTHVIAHLCAAFPDVVPTVEGVPDHTEGVDDSGYVLEDGILTIPEKSGFGMPLEFARPVPIYRAY